jgi:hypothetical protein
MPRAYQPINLFAKHFQRMDSWKWLAHEFRKQAAAKPFVPLLEELVAESAAERQVELVLKISGELHKEMKSRGIITEEGDNHPFPLFHAYSELLASGKSNAS